MNPLEYLNQMKYKIFKLFSFLSLLNWYGCNWQEQHHANIRPLADTIGFAQYDWQMDSLITRIGRLQINLLRDACSVYPSDNPFKMVISPHDDYSYVGYLYPAILKNIKAKTIFLFGVAHKARNFNLENQIIFENFDYWKGPYGPVKVSSFRNEVMSQLPLGMYQVNDSLQKMEHSLEALIPFLQHFNKDFEIIPILVPYMSFDKMEWVGRVLSNTIYSVAQDNNWKWGTDFAFVISNDAVHYGDEDWGGKNFAWLGTDSIGYQNAIEHEQEVIAAITGRLDLTKIKSFNGLTVQDTNFREYKWTWCGRYSVPVGLLTAFFLNKIYGDSPLNGTQIGYSTSIGHSHIPVEDLRIGVTAPANINHWVGYAAIAYY